MNKWRGIRLRIRGWRDAVEPGSVTRDMAGHHAAYSRLAASESRLYNVVFRSDSDWCIPPFRAGAEVHRHWRCGQEIHFGAVETLCIRFQFVHLRNSKNKNIPFVGPYIKFRPTHGPHPSFKYCLVTYAYATFGVSTVIHSLPKLTAVCRANETAGNFEARRSDEKGNRC